MAQYTDPLKAYHRALVFAAGSHAGYGVREEE
jgi:hypothetical protein